MSKVFEAFQLAGTLFLQDIINLYHLGDYRKRTFYKGLLAKKLLKEGIYTVENFLPAEDCDRIYDQIIQLTETYKQSTKLENGTFLEYRSSNTANGPDKGMIDIYNIDRSIALNLNMESVENVLRQCTSSAIYHTSIHSYVNRGVEGTRVFHVDNCQPVVYKAFIYLTDVDSTDCGPYAFVKGSQRFSPTVYFNLFRNIFIKKFRIMDMPVFNKNKEVIGLGKKGTLIVSNQNGIHRGYPQKKGKERVALVINYMVVSKMNYLHGIAKKTIEESIKQL